MSAATTRPAYDPDTAEENSRRKARAIAEYAWRLGVTFDELGRLPYSDKANRSTPSLRRFAVAAYRAGDVEENPPHKRTSDTWRYVGEELADLADRDRFGMEVPARDLAGDKGEWIAATPDAKAPAPAPPPEPPSPPRRVRPVDLVPYAVPPALVASGSPPLRPGDVIPDAPRGWAELAALGPLPWPAAVCRWCGSRAIVGTLNGYRCAEHPPRRRDPRGDWGWALNWTPNPARVCLAAACYCGRCEHYDPSGAGLRSGARAGQAAS